MMKERNSMRQGNRRNGIIGLLIMLVLAVVVIFGSGKLYGMFDKDKAGENAAASELKDGSYEVESAYDEKGYKDTLKMVVTDGKITELAWDNVDQDGNGKVRASLAGEYVMTEDGLTWARQAELLAEYVIAEGSATGLNMDENGKTDAISGVSISINGFIAMVEEAFEKAAVK